MARLDRTRLDGARFPVVTQVPVRWADLDMQGHVNNAAAVTILQEGRVAFNRAAGLPSALGDARAMVVGLTVEYAAELHHPDPVEVHSGVVAIGRTSFTIGQIVRQRGRAAIFSEATMVMATMQGATPLPDEIRGMLKAMQVGVGE